MSNKQFAVLTGHPGDATRGIEPGQVIVDSVNTPDWASCRLEIKRATMNKGILNVQKRSALVRAKKEDLLWWMEANGLKKAGDKVAGRIFIREQAGEPFYEGQEPKMNQAGGEVLVDADGNEIFRDTFFVLEEDVTEDMRDILVQHVNDLTGQTVDTTIDAGAGAETK